MKVELEKLRLSTTALGERVCIGISDKDGISFKTKHDVTSDFIKAVIDWGGGYKRKITAGNKCWEVTVKKIK